MSVANSDKESAELVQLRAEVAKLKEEVIKRVNAKHSWWQNYHLGQYNKYMAELAELKKKSVDTVSNEVLGDELRRRVATIVEHDMAAHVTKLRSSPPREEIATSAAHEEIDAVEEDFVDAPVDQVQTQDREEMNDAEQDFAVPVSNRSNKIKARRIEKRVNIYRKHLQNGTLPKCPECEKRKHGPYKCQKCAMTFKHFWKLTQHKRTHETLKNPKKCPFPLNGNKCTYLFQNKKNTQTHMQDTHEMYWCKRCNPFDPEKAKTFKAGTEWEKDEHLLQKHGILSCHAPDVKGRGKKPIKLNAGHECPVHVICRCPNSPLSGTCNYFIRRDGGHECVDPAGLAAQHAN